MNILIIENLTLLENSAEGFRKIAFSNAISTIKKLNYEIEDISQLRNLPGFGKGILSRIDEIIKTKKLSEVENLDQEIFLENNFQKVWGIGPTTAKKLYENGARKIDDLFLNEYNSLLSEKQKRGLFYYYDFEKKVHFSLIDKIVEEIFDLFEVFLKNNNASGEIFSSGSYLRCEEELGDLDLILTSKNFTLLDFVDFLVLNKIIIDVFSLGKDKFHGVVKLENGQYFRVDIIFSTRQNLPFSQFYFTGPKEFVVRARTKAKKMGYSLNEFGLFSIKNNSRVSKIKTEKDIFKFLEMKYLCPEDRL